MFLTPIITFGSNEDACGLLLRKVRRNLKKMSEEKSETRTLKVPRARRPVKLV
jgi:hypothetical protein